MPELAEVETVRKVIDREMRGKKIKDIELDPSDRYLFQFANPELLKKTLLGRKLTGTGRRGKYFWLEFDKGPDLIIHLGMSGNVSIRTPKAQASRYKNIWDGITLQSEDKSRASPAGREEPLWFCRFLMKLTDGTEVALRDPRRFGRVWLADDAKTHPRIKKLGPDPLLDFPLSKELHAKLQKRKQAIKALLLDQSLFAGIGNWLADEILFHARMSPHHRASDLSAQDVSRLRKSIMAITKKAVSVDADYERFPKSWIFHHRWGKSKNAKVSTGQAILHEEIGGRTTAWVPSLQK